MGKTGGGQGTNQYAVRGRSKHGGTAAATSSVDDEIALAPEPIPDEVTATIPLAWDVSGIDVSGIHPRGVERAIWRFQRQMTSLIFNDAALEGNTYTEPEVQTLLDGVTVAGHSEAEEVQILNLSTGADLILDLVRGGQFAIDRSTTCRLHALIAKNEAIDAGLFRGENPSSGGGGTVNVLGQTTFHGPPAGSELVDLFDDGLTRIAKLPHPVLRGATYAAFAAYNQFFFDGNKRTSRYMMNGELMSNGFDPILTPVSRKQEYNAALAVMYRTGDATAYIDFTVSLYDDGHRTS